MLVGKLGSGVAVVDEQRSCLGVVAGFWTIRY